MVEVVVVQKLEITLPIPDFVGCAFVGEVVFVIEVAYVVFAQARTYKNIYLQRPLSIYASVDKVALKIRQVDFIRFFLSMFISFVISYLVSDQLSYFNNDAQLSSL